MNQTHDILPTIKFLSYPLFGWLLSYTNISKEGIVILTILLVADVLTALLRVAVTEPHALSSRTGILGILSKLLTITIPFIVAIVGKGAGADLSYLVVASMKILIIYEGLSVFTNIVQIRKKDKTIQENDVISMLIKKIQSVFYVILDNLFSKVPDKNSRKETEEEVEQKEAITLEK